MILIDCCAVVHIVCQHYAPSSVSLFACNHISHITQKLTVQTPLASRKRFLLFSTHTDFLSFHNFVQVVFPFKPKSSIKNEQMINWNRIGWEFLDESWRKSFISLFYKTLWQALSTKTIRNFVWKVKGEKWSRRSRVCSSRNKKKSHEKSSHDISSRSRRDGERDVWDHMEGGGWP